MHQNIGKVDNSLTANAHHVNTGFKQRSGVSVGEQSNHRATIGA
jgi:hypothetical protein